MREEFPEESARAEEYLSILTPEERQDVLELVFKVTTDWMMKKMGRTEVSWEESKRWAKVTEIVYRKALMKLEFGPVVHGLLTVSIILGTDKIVVEAGPDKKTGGV